MATVTTVVDDWNFTELIVENIEFSRFGASPFLEWVEENFEPGDIFDPAVLAQWALDNGYVKNES